MEKFLKQHAPWFKGLATEITWAPYVQFGSFLVERFGSGNCILIGDAAHQAEPIGVQSMNIGLREAADIAGRISRIHQGESTLETISEFFHERQSEWQQLLVWEGLKAGSGADPWIVGAAKEIASCIPASGQNLSQLLAQLQIEFHPHVESLPV